jgi:hypothetical protein
MAIYLLGFRAAAEILGEGRLKCGGTDGWGLDFIQYEARIWVAPEAPPQRLLECNHE